MANDIPSTSFQNTPTRVITNDTTVTVVSDRKKIEEFGISSKAVHTGGSDRKFNPAPRIDLPDISKGIEEHLLEMDGDNFYLSKAQNFTTKLLVDSAAIAIKNNRDASTAQTKKAHDAQMAAYKKAEGDEIGNWAKSIFGLIGAAFGFIASVIVAALTVGIALPIAIMAGVGLALAILDFASMAKKETAKKEGASPAAIAKMEYGLVGLSTAIANSVNDDQKKLLLDNVKTGKIHFEGDGLKNALAAMDAKVTETAGNIALGLNIFVTVMSLAPNAVMLIKNILGTVTTVLTKFGKSLSETALAVSNVISNVADVTSMVAETAAAISAICVGISKVLQAALHKEAAEANTEHLFREDLVAMIQNTIEEIMDYSKAVSEAYNQRSESLAEMMSEYVNTMARAAPKLA